MISNFILKIRRKEGMFFTYLNRAIRKIMLFNIPCIRPIYKFFWYERKLRISSFSWFLKAFYYTPLFKSICFKVGKNLDLVNGIPDINENLKIIIGDNVCIYAKETGFSGGKILDTPILEIGSNTYIGPGVKIGTCKKISIGQYCYIAARVYMSDNDGHSLSWQKRRERMPADADSVFPISIEDDVWVGEGVFICKGVKIGRGAIIGSRSVLTKDVEPFSVVAGNPAKLIKSLIE